MDIPFVKYHGTGNDFVLIDNRKKLLSGIENDWFRTLCHRRFGIGADGVILLNLHDAFDFEMDYFNSDGNRSSMCGNGGRCIVRYAADLGMIRENASFLAVDGPHEAILEGENVRLKMGVPTDFKVLENGDYYIDTGSPHCVRFLTEPVEQYPVVLRGREIRNAAPWSDSGVNVNFVNVVSPGQLLVRTYERGVEDETWSCGTGVTAVAEVYARVALEGQLPEVILKTPGGMLKVNPGYGREPWLSGPALFVFSGLVKL